MEAFQVAQAVRRAIQFTVAQKVTREVEARVGDLQQRVGLTCAVALLAVMLRRTQKASANVVADLALMVATTTLMQGIAANGPDSLPLKLAHLCAVLEAGSVLGALALGELGETFVKQVQYTFANAVSALLLSGTSSVVSLAAAGGLAGISAWGSSVDGGLSTAFSQAAFNVVKTLLMQSIPGALQLPTIAGILAFTKPLRKFTGSLGVSIYSFALYQSGDGIQTALEAELQPFTAACAAVTAAFIIPIESIRAASEVAAVGSITDWFLAMIQEASDKDPVPSLLSILVFSKVVLSMFTSD